MIYLFLKISIKWDYPLQIKKPPFVEWIYIEKLNNTKDENRKLVINYFNLYNSKGG